MDEKNSAEEPEGKAPEEKKPEDAYRTRTLRLARYVRYLPILVVVGFIPVTGLMLVEGVLGLALTFGVLIPGYLLWQIRSARPGRPEPAADGADSGVPVLLWAAIVLDLGAVLWWHWEPACRYRDDLWVALGFVTAGGALLLTAVLYVRVWLGRRALINARPGAAAGARDVRLLERTTRQGGLQIFLVGFVIFLLAPSAPEHKPTAYDIEAHNSGSLILPYQERFRETNGRYADNLEDLLQLEGTLLPDPEVTFQFGYAGQTGFTFTSSHARGCEPVVFGN